VHNEPEKQTFRRCDVAAIIDGAQVLLDDGIYRVLCLNNASASAWWGDGTRWCTANGGWFAGYRQYGELLYIEHRPKARRWQLYIHNFEFRNARNRRANGQVFARIHPTAINALSSRIRRDVRASLVFGLAPDGIRIDHSVLLRGIPIESLPAEMQVRDDLDLRATGLTALPNGLRVGGDLLLSARATPKLPQDLEVRGRIFLCDGWDNRTTEVVASGHQSLTSDPRPDLIRISGQMRGVANVGHRQASDR
jgi:hypothetical protein